MNKLNKILVKNTSHILLIRLLAMGLSFLLVPIAYEFLGSYSYGIWATIFSFANWINLMDVGFSNGLRNSLTTGIDKDDKISSRRIISTGYISLGILTFTLIIITLIIGRLFNLGLILDIHSNLNLTSVLTYSIILMLVNLFMKLIHAIFYATYKPQWIFIVNLISNVIILLSIFNLKPSNNEENNLLIIAFLFLGIPILIYLIVSLFFLNQLRLVPKFKYYHKEYLKDLLNQSSKFFLIQVAVVIVNTSDTFIINTLFSPSITATFSILNKYSSIVLIGTTTFLTPLWALYTKAHLEGNYIWIKNIIRKQRKALIYLIASCIFLVLISNFVFEKWIGEDFNFDHRMLSLIFLIATISYWNNIHSFYLNGIGDLKLQTATSFISIIINIPLSIIFADLFGVNGVLLATIISISIFGILGTIEVNRKLRLSEITS